MSKHLKKKLSHMLLVELVFILLLGSFLLQLQTQLSVRSQKTANEATLDQIEELMAKRETDAQQIRESYDEVYTSKARTIAFMALKEPVFEMTGQKLRELRDLFHISNLLILDNQGSVIAAAEDWGTDYRVSRYNQLRTVFQDGKPSQAFNVTGNDRELRYYGAKINANQMVVVAQDPQELNELLETSTSIPSVFKRISVGLAGYAMAVSHTDYAYLYHPDESMLGKGAPGTGLKAGDLMDGQSGWAEINGERFLCSTRLIGDVYAVCATPEAEINAARLSTVTVTLAAFFITVTLVVAYAFFIKAQEERDGRDKLENYKKIGSFYYNKEVGRKILAVSGVGLAMILLVSVFMQTLFSLSRQTMSSRHLLNTIAETNESNQQELELLKQQYDRRYLNKAQALAEILKKNPHLLNRGDLSELRDILDVENIWVFDENGRTVATDSNYWDFTVSSDPQQASYAFQELLKGHVSYLIQEAQPNETTGELCQYMGVTLGEPGQGNAGFVQIQIAPEKLQELLSSIDVKAVLSGVKTGSQGFAFGVSKADQTFSYYPESKLIGKSALDYGVKESALRDEYEDFLQLKGKSYYCSSTETADNLIYVAVPSGEMNQFCIPVALVTAAGSLICLILISLILSLSHKPKESEKAGEAEADNRVMVDVVMPDGQVKKTVAASKRWTQDGGPEWNEKTPEQKLLSLLSSLIFGAAVVLAVVILFKDRFFPETSIMHYILDGRWEKSFNIFAFTSAVILFIIVNVISAILRRLLMVFAKVFGARGETICRLLESVMKYLTILVLLYYCFAMFGVDTKTLLASAGILSVIIGLGSQALISDILAGLFIVFEGEFRVGDIVTIGDWRGTVIEIGVRTTKIKDASNNIKIINNSNVSNVVNMTKQFSFAACDVGIEYGESLERVESILKKELPVIKEHLPAIVEGPFYKGVVSLGDSSVNIRLVAKCAEGDRMQLIRDLNREIKLIFDRHEIGIPFPQIVVNQPVAFEKATWQEKILSQEFVNEQKEQAKNLEEVNKEDKDASEA